MNVSGESGLHVHMRNDNASRYSGKAKADLLEIGPYVDVMEIEKHHRHILDNMMEGFLILDYDWCYLYVNDVMVKQAHTPGKN